MAKKKKLFTDTKELKQYISKNGFDSIDLFCNHVLEYYLKADKIAKRLINKYIEAHDNYNPNTLYFDMYKDKILLPGIIYKYYDTKIFTSDKINKALILEHGRNYPDGFSGIKIKKMSYTNDYIIQIVDGERGSLFCKTYNGVPTLDQLIYDSVFYEILCNDSSKEYKPSIIDLF